MLLSTVNLVTGKRTEKNSKKGRRNTACEHLVEDTRTNYEDKTGLQRLHQGPHCEKLGQIQTTDVSVEEQSRGSDGEISSGYGSSESTSTQHGTTEFSSHFDTVSIATPDGYNIYVDPTYYHIRLKSQTQTTCCSSFRQVTLSSEDKANGTFHLVAFHLASDPEYYLTTNKNRSLELQMYQNSRPHLENPDERCFVLHRLCSGVVFIQPYHHKSYYIHHIDEEVSVQKLEINYRPPEEYYFYIKPTISAEESGENFVYPDTCVVEQEPEVVSDSTIDSCRNEIPESKETKSISEKCENVSLESQDQTYENSVDSNDHGEDETQKVNLRRKGSKKIKLAKRNSFYNTVNLGSCFGFSKKNKDSVPYASCR